MTYIEWFHEGKLPRERVGGKGPSLSELAGAGFPVPGGFCVNAEGYRRFVATGGIEEGLEQAVSGARLERFEGVLTASPYVPPLLVWGRAAAGRPGGGGRNRELLHLGFNPSCIPPPFPGVL